MRRDAALTKALDRANGFAGLGRLIGVSAQAIWQWQRVPAERVLDVERVTGVARSKLRPDLYPPRRRKGEGRRTETAGAAA